MPKGVAVGTLAIGTAGAYNAALLAIQVLALHDETIATKLDEMRQTQTETILASPTPGIINS
jgi:5-(carboxyamino)imidazole ribonucleotide mutase